jgi:hypothetical protein
MPNTTMVAPTGTMQIQGPGGPYVVASDGTVSVPADLVPAMFRAGCTLIGQQVDMVHFQCPAAADLVSIVAAASPTSGTAMTIAAQPGAACKLQVRGVYSGAVAGLVVNLVGTDGRGNAITETVNVAAASSTTFTTANAYSHVTSVTPVGTVTNVTTIGVGVSGALALPLPPTFVDLVVFKENVYTAGTAAAPADETVGTVDTVAGTIVPTTAPNAVKCFDIYFAWTTPA